MKFFKGGILLVVIFVFGCVNITLASDKFLSLPFDYNTTLLQGWFYNNGTIHKGIDYRCKIGDPIYAAADGLAMHSVQKINSTYAYGNFVFINHQNGYATLYAHLSKVNSGINKYPEKMRGNIKYEEWTYIRKGEYIGDCGNSGTIDPHLHFESTEGKYAIDKIDSYDLHKVGSYYPFNNNYKKLGKNYLWEFDPPNYIDIDFVEELEQPTEKTW